MNNGTGHYTDMRGGAHTRMAHGVTYMTAVFANLYCVDVGGDSPGAWALVDTGLAHFAARVRSAARGKYGEGARPASTILTHGHFDHAGGGGRTSKGRRAAGAVTKGARRRLAAGRVRA
jgi:glyoxylase-like metal-dependent hydrolase (beta-lactamase superfamily II)